jgi:hypothetical protein
LCGFPARWGLRGAGTVVASGAIMPIRRLRRRCRDGPGHGCARAITGGITRVTVQKFPEVFQERVRGWQRFCLLPGRPPGAGRRGLRRQIPEGRRKGHGDLDQLLAFYDYPAEHWVYLRTTDENVNGMPWAWAGVLVAGLSSSLRCLRATTLARDPRARAVCD